MVIVVALTPGAALAGMAAARPAMKVNNDSEDDQCNARLNIVIILSTKEILWKTARQAAILIGDYRQFYFLGEYICYQ